MNTESASARDPKTTPSHRRFFESGGPDVLVEQEKKDRILMAAAALFASKGYAGTAIREIVEAAGVTKPTLYYYFKDKEDLYVKLMDEAMEAFAQILEESLIRSGSMRERLVSLFCNVIELFQRHVDCVRLVNAMMHGSREAAPEYDYTASKSYLESVLSEILHLGVVEGELLEENAGAVILLLMSLLRNVQVMLTMDPDPLFTADSITMAIDLIFDGARAPLSRRE
jgi:TetR/AcrR family transcriptional regulator